MKKTIVFIFFLASIFNVNAQQHTKLSRSELGLMLGGAMYLGDLNPYFSPKRIAPAASLFYRFNYHTRMALRANFTYGSVSAYDSDNGVQELYKNRNLDFKTDIYELGAGIEFYYMKFQLGNKRYSGTAYLLAELALFHMNPKGSLNGSWVPLQPLGTEGQGSDLSSRGRYSLIQLSIPLGVGCKFSMGKKATIGFEAGMRKTFTDYLDDVSSYTYVDPTQLALANGPSSAAMSNKSLDGSRYGRRGNAATKDWYMFFGATVSFRLGNPRKCYEF